MHQKNENEKIEIRIERNATVKEFSPASAQIERARNASENCFSL